MKVCADCEEYQDEDGWCCHYDDFVRPDDEECEAFEEKELSP